jgi:glycosyltransferase involved in cell wall biosynthesis
VENKEEFIPAANQKNMPVSVIIPTYNRQEWLAEAVRSALDQTVAPDEVIVVDDGSTDSTAQLVARLAREAAVPVRYLYQDNRGAAAARNSGIRAARFDTVCFLDSDDRFATDKIASQYPRLLSSGHLISHTCESWLRRGQPLAQKIKHRPPDGDVFAASLSLCVVGMSTVMARRELFARYGLFDETLPCCEDYDLWLRVGCRERFLLVDTPLTLKNGGRPDQLSVIHRQGMDRYRIRSLASLLESGILTKEQAELALRELQRKCAIYGRGCIKHGKEEEGRSVLQLPEGIRRKLASATGSARAGRT